MTLSTYLFPCINFSNGAFLKNLIQSEHEGGITMDQFKPK